jgi:hypothetical protein
MAIWTPSPGEVTNAGADAGTLFKGSSTGSRVIQSKVTPANAQARAEFSQWGRLGFWQSVWDGLSGAVQTEWNDFSLVNPDYGLSGRAVIKSGADHFACYQNRLELMSGTTPTAPFATPAPSPSWTAPAAPFGEFLVFDAVFSMVLATTQPDPITLFLAVRQPSKGKGNMARSTQRPLASYTFATMTQGDLFATACEDAATRFGVIADSTTVQQWFTVWQAIGGYARPLLDPCWTPPPVAPPTNTVVLSATLYGSAPVSWTLTQEVGTQDWLTPSNQASAYGTEVSPGVYTWVAHVGWPVFPFSLFSGTKGDSPTPVGSYATFGPPSTITIT